MSACDYSFFILNDNTIKCCGDNSYGQLGLGDVIKRTIPTIMQNLTNVKQIACGTNHTLFLFNDGTVKACGYNINGELGLGDTTNRNTPVTIPNLTNVKQIACGNSHTIFLLNDGTVKACGLNNSGQLGIGNTTNQLNPVLIPNLINIKQIACGSAITMFLLNDETVKASGYNANGELGLGNTTNKNTPVLISNLINVKQVACGANHTVFLLNDGTVKSCGYNNSGQLGLGDTIIKNTPVLISNLINVKQIDCGNSHTILLLNDGTVKVCGNNTHSQLGLGNTIDKIVPTIIPNLTNVKQIACGSRHTVFLLNDGTVKVCGNNASNQLGLGDTTNRSIPTIIPDLTNVKLLSIFISIIILFILKQNNLFYSIQDLYYDTATKTYTPLSSFDISQGFEITSLCVDKTINGETFKPIDKFNSFQIITSENVPLSIKGIKTNKELIVASGDINTTVADNIDSFTISTNLSGNGNIKLAISVDSGLTWKGYNGTSFIDLSCTIPLKNYNELSSTELAQWNDAIEKISVNGITPTVFNTINFNLLNTEKIRFAYVLDRPSTADAAETTQLNWQFDANGFMRKMIDSEYAIDLYNKQVKIIPAISNSIIKANIME